MIGIVLRSFARTPDKVGATVEKLVACIRGLYSCYDRPGANIVEFFVMIPTGDLFKDSDCGTLGPELERVLSVPFNASDRSPKISVYECQDEDLFVGVQNHALRLMEGLDMMVVAAPSAIQAGYLSMETLDAMVEAHYRGAKIMPVVVPEDGIDEFVLRGTAGGPIIGWDVPALLEADGFDQSAAQGKIGEENPNQGCEEIHPIIRIERKHGACYVPIMPRGMALRKRVLEGDELARHTKQIQTKTARQLFHARSLGVESLDFFRDMVMPD